MFPSHLLVLWKLCILSFQHSSDAICEFFFLINLPFFFLPLSLLLSFPLSLFLPPCTPVCVYRGAVLTDSTPSRHRAFAH